MAARVAAQEPCPISVQPAALRPGLYWQGRLGEVGQIGDESRLQPLSRGVSKRWDLAGQRMLGAPQPRGGRAGVPARDHAVRPRERDQMAAGRGRTAGSPEGGAVGEEGLEWVQAGFRSPRLTFLCEFLVFPPHLLHASLAGFTKPPPSTSFSLHSGTGLIGSSSQFFVPPEERQRWV